MDTTRINVPLTKSEAVALIRIAEAECRHPREQMRYLLIKEAQQRGLLPKEVEKEDRHEPEQRAT